MSSGSKGQRRGLGKVMRCSAIPVFRGLRRVWEVGTQGTNPPDKMAGQSPGAIGGGQRPITRTAGEWVGEGMRNIWNEGRKGEGGGCGQRFRAGVPGYRKEISLESKHGKIYNQQRGLDAKKSFDGIILKPVRCFRIQDGSRVQLQFLCGCDVQTWAVGLTHSCLPHSPIHINPSLPVPSRPLNPLAGRP